MFLPLLNTYNYFAFFSDVCLCLILPSRPTGLPFLTYSHAKDEI